MALRRCTLCGESKEQGVGKTTFVCDECLGLQGRDVIEVMRGFTSTSDLTSFLSQKYRVPMCDLAAYEVAAETCALLTREFCLEHVVMPVSCVGRSLIVAVTDPGAANVLAVVREMTGLVIEPVISSREDILAAIARQYG